MSGEQEVVADLELASTLADRADEITLARFGALDLRVDTKPDLSPVTDADEAVEAEIRTILARQRPDDAIFGEEQGGTPVLEGRQWVIDPIDGTKNFVRGVPVWASLIALLEDGVPTVGVISAPALNRRWWAARTVCWQKSATTPWRAIRNGSHSTRRLAPEPAIPFQTHWSATRRLTLSTAVSGTTRWSVLVVMITTLWTASPI
jgi:fructose-1,6-bisphosphatase/inositol monophosphatase family enzyme